MLALLIFFVLVEICNCAHLRENYELDVLNEY